MKFKAPASCARRAEHLRPVKISQKGGKGIGTNIVHSIVPACATNHGVDFLWQDTADLWRITVWVRLPFSRTEHSCCLDVRGYFNNCVWQSAWDVSSLENSLLLGLRQARMKGIFVLCNQQVVW